MTPLFTNKMLCRHFCYGFSLRPSRDGVYVRSLRKTVEDNERSEVLKKRGIFKNREFLNGFF